MLIGLNFILTKHFVNPKICFILLNRIHKKYFANTFMCDFFILFKNFHCLNKFNELIPHYPTFRAHYHSLGPLVYALLMHYAEQTKSMYWTMAKLCIRLLIFPTTITSYYLPIKYINRELLKNISKLLFFFFKWNLVYKKY